MEGRRGYAVGLSALDSVYLRRACELAQRARGSTSPNPPVGAVIVRETTTLGEGFHHLRGEPHAETQALRDAAARGAEVRGATLYVTLEPCDHTGLTPPCTGAVIEAGIARVVVGVPDPNPRTAGAGIARLRAAGVSVTIADDEWCRRLVTEFAVTSARSRPYVRLKLAASLDGCVMPKPGEPYWLTGSSARAYVRELRASHDAVLVGAGTVRVDDPQLTVRPAAARRKPYRRIVACEHAAVPAQRAVFAPREGYAATIVLAPRGLRREFAELECVCEVLYVGDADATTLDLAAALEALRAHDVATILCEGGPTLASRLFGRGLVDRFDWILAPLLLSNPAAVRALGDALGDVEPGAIAGRKFRYEQIEALGDDVVLTGVPMEDAACSAA